MGFTGLTDIHHQGHIPSNDIQNGDNGEKETSFASLVHFDSGMRRCPPPGRGEMAARSG